MKFSSAITTFAFLSTAVAFTPNKAFVSTRSAIPSSSASAYRSKYGGVLFMAEETLEEEVERLVEEEINKTKKISNLRNQNGVEYAPWMKISQEDEERIRKMTRDKAEARRRRQEEESDVSGALSLDSQAQELSGSGLRYKVINDGDVELEWATASETSTKGFIVKRRPAKVEGYETIASYETNPTLVSRGAEGGVYRYLDEAMAPGGYVYRITECEMNGNQNDLSQCLVDVQAPGEQRGTIIAVAGLGAVAIAAVLAGFLLDPTQY